SMPILRDERQLVAQQLGVTRTCEVIAIDTKNSAIIYRGALDDQFSEGAQKPRPTEKYLVNALEEFLADKPVTTPTAPVHGCRITFENEPASQPISYSGQIAPLLQKHCVGCHSPGNIGPFAMPSHKKIKGWSALI